MSLLTGKEIIRCIEAGEITVDPFDPKMVGPNSLDLRWSNEMRTYMVFDDMPLDMQKSNPTIRHHFGDEGYILHPGVLYLMESLESVGSAIYVPVMYDRSSIGRLGIECHLGAGFGDLGFGLNGEKWTLEVRVTHPVRIYPNSKVCQIAFETTVGDRSMQYDGRYKHQRGPTASRFHQ